MEPNLLKEVSETADKIESLIKNSYIDRVGNLNNFTLVMLKALIFGLLALPIGYIFGVSTAAFLNLEMISWTSLSIFFFTTIAIALSLFLGKGGNKNIPIDRDLDLLNQELEILYRHLDRIAAFTNEEEIKKYLFKIEQLHSIREILVERKLKIKPGELKLKSREKIEIESENLILKTQTKEQVSQIIDSGREDKYSSKIT